MHTLYKHLKGSASGHSILSSCGFLMPIENLENKIPSDVCICFWQTSKEPELTVQPPGGPHSCQTDTLCHAILLILSFPRNCRTWRSRAAGSSRRAPEAWAKPWCVHKRGSLGRGEGVAYKWVCISQSSLTLIISGQKHVGSCEGAKQSSRF